MSNIGKMEVDSTSLDVLKIMLSQRGVVVDTIEDIGESELQGRIQKVGEYLLYFSSKSRISEKDILEFLDTINKSGTSRGIIIVESPSSSVILNLIRKHSDIIQIFHKKQLIFDITTHRKVSPHRILTGEEKISFLERFRVNPDFTPCIDSQDAMAKWIGARPGDVVEVLRKSETAGLAPYSRMCVASAS